ncbi:MAG: phosphotransferase [Acidobacteria bacterium]|nr:phosphotransferase [Acidobacteriota bacterium]
MIEERIKERMGCCLPNLQGGGLGAGVRWKPLLGRGHDSKIYETTVANEDGSGGRLILKLHRPAWAASHEAVQQGEPYARREYESLSWLWREFSRRSARFAVPKPFDYFPECAGLVVQKCEGKPLDQLLRWARLLKTSSQREKLYACVGACGEWLELFHRITARAGPASETYQRINRDFHHDLETCVHLGLDAGLASQVAYGFEQRKSIAASGDSQRVGYHCDFGPHNVLVSDEKITVLDFEGLQEGIIYEDLCYFLGMIETFPLYHLSHKICRGMKESFLKGYSRRGNLDWDQLDLFMPVATVKFMAHNPRLKPQTGWLDQRRRQQRLRVYTNWLARRVR